MRLPAPDREREIYFRIKVPDRSDVVLRLLKLVAAISVTSERSKMRNLTNDFAQRVVTAILNNGLTAESRHRARTKPTMTESLTAEVSE